MTREEEILQNMKKLGLTRQESEELYEDDHSDIMTEEQAELEEKAKKLGRRYEKDTKKVRKPTSRERKVDNEKKVILQALTECVTEKIQGEIIEVKTETEIKFVQNGNIFTVKLIKARPKK